MLQACSIVRESQYPSCCAESLKAAVLRPDRGYRAGEQICASYAASLPAGKGFGHREMLRGQMCLSDGVWHRARQERCLSTGKGL